MTVQKYQIKTEPSTKVEEARRMRRRRAMMDVSSSRQQMALVWCGGGDVVQTRVRQQLSSATSTHPVLSPEFNGGPASSS